MDKTKYEEKFFLPPKVRAVAWEKAWETRNFEIEMYWKRATYFWAFIASAFGGYLLILGKEGYAVHEPNNAEYLVACIGLVLSLAWVNVNRGSKTWQKNWETHIDLLEDELSGPLYKTVLIEKTHSVSRVNDRISWMFVVVWLGLTIKYWVDKKLFTTTNFQWDIFVIVTSFGTGFFIYQICLETISEPESQRKANKKRPDNRKMDLRETPTL